MMALPPLWMAVAGFVLLLAPLIVLHELGHYIAGRLCKVKVETFSVGFGREVWGWTDRRGTRWKLGLLPLGGYVQFAGDMNPASMPADISGLSDAEKVGNFHAKPLWQRAFVVAAGPLANLLVALVIFAGFNMAYGRVDLSRETPAVISAFATKSAARAAGLQVGDRIVAINGAPVNRFIDIPDKVQPNPGKVLRLGIVRGTARIEVPVTAAAVDARDAAGRAVRVGQLGIRGGWSAVGPVEAVMLAGKQCWSVVRMMGGMIGQIIVGHRPASELGGPVKIAQVAGEQLNQGPPAFVFFVALISINLAFINLLPIPVLDGGHLAFYAAEALRGKPLGPRSQEWAFRTGLAFVLALMLFVTVNDLASFHLFGR